MQITVQNIGGSSLGPFDIYYDVYAPGFLVASNVSSASMAAGVNVTVTNVATTLIVVNNRPGCGNQQQVIPLPPPVTPTVYESVDISARMGATTTLPTTASVYYMIDSSGYNYLGDFSTNVCESYPTIPVPLNSTLFLGIISGSNSVSFNATGSTYLCNNLSATPSIFCGITTPFIHRVTGTTDISLQAKVATGPPATIITCGITPTPPGPVPPPITPATLAYTGTNGALIRLQIERQRPASPTDLIILDITSIPVPTGIFTNSTIPNILPGDVLIITITSEVQPVQKGVVLNISNNAGGGDVQLYNTSGFTYTDTYALTVQSGGVYTVTVSDFI